MKNPKRLLFAAVIFVTSFLLFSSASASTNVDNNITTSATWTKAGSPYVVRKGIYINTNVSLTIDPGVIVKFDYQKGAGIIVSGKLTAVGTDDEKIVFTSIRDDSFGGDTNADGDLTKPAPGDWTGIDIQIGLGATLDNVNLYYASSPYFVTAGIRIINNDNVSIKNSEIEYCGYAGMLIYDSQPLAIEKNLISNDRLGIMIQSKKKAKISNNVIANNSAGGLWLAGMPMALDQIDARDNWWGDATGPYFKSYWYSYLLINNGKGNSVGDGVLFDPWFRKDPKFSRKPIVFIPGIGASFNPDLMISSLANDNWTMFDHTYDGMIESFKSMGYEEGKDLFIAYYDWRNSNADSAQNYLEPIIAKANSLNGTSKVNIVAHSMGGLVARSYIQSAHYASDVDNLIMIAPPNKGSSDVYATWEGGSIPDSWDGKVMMETYLNYLKMKNANFSAYDIVHQFIPSVKELMPLYSYLYVKDDSQNLKDYLSMNEKNNFLADLNAETDKLSQRVKVSIIMGNKQPTVDRIPVTDSDSNSLWADGKPEPLDPQKDDSSGDGEVLLSSAEIPNIFKSILDYGHKDIVSQSEKIVADRLNENLDSIYDAPQINNEMGIWFASPLDVEIKAPDGKIITSKNVNEIPLAKYASESEPTGEPKPNGFKIFSISNLLDGKYEIKITGNGDGEYHIGSEFADYTGTKKDASSLVRGAIKKGDVMEYKVEYDSKNTETPIKNIELKDTTPPTISGATTTNPNENGWYNSDVTVHFTAEDSESGVASVTEDQTVSTEGENQEVFGKAVDKAGNEASFVVKNINIDKTLPETQVLLNESPNISNWYSNDVKINFTAQDNLSAIYGTYYSLDGGSYQTGNEIVIDAEGVHDVKYYSVDKAGNKESEKEITFKIDKTAPEVKIQFDSNTQKLNFSGMDNLSQNINVALSVQINSNSDSKINKIKDWFFNWFQKKEKQEEKIDTVTLTDEAGNVTIVIFAKTKDTNNRIFITLKSIAYNGMETALANTTMQYKWQVNHKNQFNQMATHIQAETNSLEAHYISRKNQTWLMEKPRELADDDQDDSSEQRPLRTKLNGMVIPALVTEKGKVKSAY